MSSFSPRFSPRPASRACAPPRSTAGGDLLLHAGDGGKVGYRQRNGTIFFDDLGRHLTTQGSSHCHQRIPCLPCVRVLPSVVAPSLLLLAKPRSAGQPCVTCLHPPTWSRCCINTFVPPAEISLRAAIGNAQDRCQSKADAAEFAGRVRTFFFSSAATNCVGMITETTFGNSSHRISRCLLLSVIVKVHS